MQQITGFAEPVLTSAYWSPRHDYDRGHLSGREYWRAVGSHAGTQLHEEQLDRLIAADNALWTQPNQPMIAWAQRLQAAGTPTGILSNLGDEMMHGVLAAFDWMGAFHHRTWSHTLRMAKPEPAIYHHSAAGLNVPIAQILFVDDREDNIAGARSRGHAGHPLHRGTKSLSDPCGSAGWKSFGRAAGPHPRHRRPKLERSFRISPSSPKFRLMFSLASTIVKTGRRIWLLLRVSLQPPAENF